MLEQNLCQKRNFQEKIKGLESKSATHNMLLNKNWRLANRYRATSQKSEKTTVIWEEWIFNCLGFEKKSWTQNQRCSLVSRAFALHRGSPDSVSITTHISYDGLICKHSKKRKWKERGSNFSFLDKILNLPWNTWNSKWRLENFKLRNEGWNVNYKTKINR